MDRAFCLHADVFRQVQNYESIHFILNTLHIIYLIVKTILPCRISNIHALFKINDLSKDVGVYSY